MRCIATITRTAIATATALRRARWGAYVATWWRVEPARRPRRLLALALLVAVGALFAVSLSHGMATVLPHGTTAVQGHADALHHDARTSGAAHGALSIALPRPSCRFDTTGAPTASSCDATRRAAVAPNPTGRTMAPPSTSAAAIQRAFQAVGSPLADTRPRRDGRSYAEYLWDEGKRMGIDPAVVMAFFNQESTYGTRGMATETHDLANERPVPGYPVRCGFDGCYVYDATWFDGIDRIYALLSAYARQGLTTADQVIPAWAPQSDFNDDALFSSAVHNTMQALNTALS